MPALPLDVALLHANRADARGDAQYLGNDWYFDDLFCMAAKRTFVSCERIVEPERLPRPKARRRRSASPASSPTAWSRRPTARTSRTASPTTSATRPSSASTRRRPRIPTRGRRSVRSTSTSPKPTTGGPSGSRRERRIPADASPRSASSRARRRGGATARSSPARSAPSRPSAPGSPRSRSSPTSSTPTATRCSSAAPIAGRRAGRRPEDRSRRGCRSATCSTSSGRAGAT